MLAESNVFSSILLTFSTISFSLSYLLGNYFSLSLAIPIFCNQMFTVPWNFLATCKQQRLGGQFILQVGGKSFPHINQFIKIRRFAVFQTI